MIRKPVVGDLVMDVIGIEERDEQIHVEERHAAHTSSRSSFTSFIVGRAAPGGRGGSSGTPLRVRSAREGVKARRASSERTFPAVLPRSVASSFAACSTSSSMSSVVRMVVRASSYIRHLSSYITHQMSNTCPPGPRGGRATYKEKGRRVARRPFRSRPVAGGFVKRPYSTGSAVSSAAIRRDRRKRRSLAVTSKTRFGWTTRAGVATLLRAAVCCDRLAKPTTASSV